jgi:hypothetical protein
VNAPCRGVEVATGCRRQCGVLHCVKFCAAARTEDIFIPALANFTLARLFSIQNTRFREQEESVRRDRNGCVGAVISRLALTANCVAR